VSTKPVGVQGDVPVPGRVEPDLVVIHARLVLGGLEAFLHRPPCPGDLHQAVRRDRAWGVAQVERQFRWAGDALADEQGDLRPAGGYQCPVIVSGALGALAAAEPLPGSPGLVRAPSCGPTGAV
jgi:hypothetical protein